MQDDGLEVLYTDDDVQTGFDTEVFEVGSIDCDRGDEWMFQDLFTIRDLLGIAFEHASPILSSENVQQLSLRTKVLDVLSNGTRVHAPPILRHAAVEERMHDVDSLVSQLICLSDTLIADHLDDEPAIGFVVLVLQIDFAAFDCSIST